MLKQQQQQKNNILNKWIKKFKNRKKNLQTEKKNMSKNVEIDEERKKNNKSLNFIFFINILITNKQINYFPSVI